MSTISILAETHRFNRSRTLGLLDAVEQLPDPQAALSWRPGAGRAHIGWQLVHIAVTEDLFASERLTSDKSGLFTELWPRFRGGSTPDDDVPSPAEIRDTLDRSHEHLIDTLARFTNDDLGVIPEGFKERGLNLLQILHLLSWHEAHHQGQAHITLNLFKADHV